MHYKVAVYGLNKKQISLLKAALPDEYEMVVMECTTDLIVIDSVLSIIDPTTAQAQLWWPLNAYYLDVGDKLPETVVWLAPRAFPKHFSSFIYPDSFAELMTSLDEILVLAKARYHKQMGYKDIYSFLPKHAIREAIEADVYAAFHQKFGKNPDKQLKDRVRREWITIQERNEGAELLAAVYELTRYLKREKIPYRMDYDALYGLIPWILEITTVDPGQLCGQQFQGNDYVVCIPKDAIAVVNSWLHEHWYFGKCKQDGCTIVPALNRKNMLVKRTVPTPLNNLLLFPFELETGITHIDSQIMGMHPGEVILVTGRPAMGKTSFAKSVERHLNAQEKQVCYFDFVRNLKEVHKDFTDFERELRTSGADFAVFDHFQFLSDYDETDETAEALFKKIKSLATELQIPIMVLMHLNRDPEYRPDPIPRVTDIPHWKCILEKYTDTVLMLYRSVYYDPEADRTEALCIIEKAARGKWQILPLHWDDENYIFTD